MLSSLLKRYWIPKVLILILVGFATGCVSKSFVYQVQVEDQDTGDLIHRASVTIMLGGDFAPVDGVTDVNGIAMVPIDESRARKLGKVVVTAPGYNKYDKLINLNKDDLPDTIQLEPVSEQTILATNTPALSLTSTAAPPVVTPQRSPTPKSTSLPSFTPTLTPRPTSTPTFTPPPPSKTPTLTSSSTPRLKPPSPPSAVAPELVSPSKGGTFKNPIAFQWNGTLYAGQAYQVVAYHAESGYVIQSGLLTTQSWETEGLPGDKYGEWRWYVVVLDDGAEIIRSEEWLFWFRPFEPPTSPENTPTWTPPP